MKPVVHYTELFTYEIGGCAILVPTNHPNHIPGHNVSNTKPVITSEVLGYNVETGLLETKNTIYMPEIIGS